MQYRHEVKHEVSKIDMLILRQRLKATMNPDPYAVNGCYEVRSLYFDNLDDKALREKIDGAAVREKYRIRMYNNDPSVIHLERKYKYGSLGYKESAALTCEQLQAILCGRNDWMAGSTNEVINGFYYRIKTQGLKPKVIVDYTREPFVFGPGNVRVTLDHNIRTGMKCSDFFKAEALTLPVKDDPCILEIKWDNYLPDIIRNAVSLESRRCGAFSKYAAARMYD